MSTQPTQPEALRLADEWLRKTQSEADRRNSAYDHFGMDNTPEKVDPLGAKMAAELRRLHALATNQGTQPTPEDLEALLLAQHPASKHYLPAVKAKIVAAMQAAASKWGTPATGGEPVAWPENAAEVREFIGVHMLGVRYHRDDAQPHDDDRYTLSAHDLMSAFRWWTADTSPQPVREQLNTVELMRVVMKADEETRGNSLRGTTNWAAHIGKAVQAAVLAGGSHPVREPLTDEEIADFVGDEYHHMTESELRWFRLGEAAHGITGEQHGA